MYSINTCRFLFLLRDKMTESLARHCGRSQPYPLPTYLGGENQRTCLMAAFGTFPTGLGRTRKVYRGSFASTSILGSVRTVHVDLGRSSDV